MVHYVLGGVRVVEDIRTDDVVVPYGNLPLWSDAELTAIGVTREDDPPPVIDDVAVRFECKRRIYAAASEATQANLTAYMVILNQKVGAGQTLTADEQADVVLFQQAMQWISDMRGTIAGLIGDATYADDAHWPALSAELQAFAARF